METVCELMRASHFIECPYVMGLWPLLLVVTLVAPLLVARVRGLAYVPPVR
jgi:hypothetical protein